MLVIRNLRLKRGDRRGATFILLFGALTGGAALKLTAHFPPSLYDALDLWMATDAQAIYWAVLGWIFYIALEPAVRSTWPHTLVSWSRLVSGRLRDPLVGRDVLWGVCAGTLLMGFELVGDFLTEFPLNRTPTPLTLAVPALATNRDAIAVILQWLYPAALLGAFQLLLLVIFYRLTRGRRYALVLLWLFDVMVLSQGLELGATDDFFRQAFVAILASPLIVGVVFRLGLLSAAVMGYAFLVLLHLPLTTHGSSWYADASALGLIVVGGMAICGFIVSLAGKPPFGRLGP